MKGKKCKNCIYFNELEELDNGDISYPHCRKLWFSIDIERFPDYFEENCKYYKK